MHPTDNPAVNDELQHALVVLIVLISALVREYLAHHRAKPRARRRRGDTSRWGGV